MTVLEEALQSHIRTLQEYQAGAEACEEYSEALIALEVAADWLRLKREEGTPVR